MERTHQVVAGEDPLSSRSGPWSADPACKHRGPRAMPLTSRVKDRKPPRPTLSEPRGHRERIQARPPMPKSCNQRVPEFHGDAPKGVTTQHAAAAVTGIRSKVFTRNPDGERRTTTTPPRGTRHPQASPPSALERGAFARCLPRATRGTTVQDRRHQNRPPPQDLGGATAEALPLPGFPPPHSSPSTQPRRNATTTATLLAAEPTVCGLAIQGRRPGIQEPEALAPPPIDTDFAIGGDPP